MEDRLTEIRVETSTDPIMKSNTDFIANGWPSHESAVPHSVRDYYRERALLSLSDGVVTYKLQIVMPPKRRRFATTSRIAQRHLEMSRTSSQCHLVARYQSRHNEVYRSL